MSTLVLRSGDLCFCIQVLLEKDLPNSLEVDHCPAGTPCTPAGKLSHAKRWSGHEKEGAESVDEGTLSPPLPRDVSMSMT